MLVSILLSILSISLFNFTLPFLKVQFFLIISQKNVPTINVWPYLNFQYLNLQIFLQRFDWVPKPYNQSSQLPEEMPVSLQNLIKSSNKASKLLISVIVKLSSNKIVLFSLLSGPQFHVWLSCDTVSNDDKDNIVDVEYLPIPGFPVQYFPFTGQPHYLAPIVALRFSNLSGSNTKFLPHLKFNFRKFLPEFYRLTTN